MSESSNAITMPIIIGSAADESLEQVVVLASLVILVNVGNGFH